MGTDLSAAKCHCPHGLGLCHWWGWPRWRVWGQCSGASTCRVCCGFRDAARTCSPCQGLGTGGFYGFSMKTLHRCHGGRVLGSQSWTLLPVAHLGIWGLCLPPVGWGHWRKPGAPHPGINSNAGIGSMETPELAGRSRG